MKPFIVIQTDFSNTWSAVSSMKGVMKIVDPTLEIYDICHDIKKFDPWEASLSLNTVEPYWPKGTVYVSVVDPGVGTKRKACVALLNDGNYVVSPDNGSLTHLKKGIGIKAVREIDETTNKFKAYEDVSVFHGRDLFGYCAARLASGIISFEEVGKEYNVEDIIECEEYYLKPVLEKDYAEGFIQTGLKHFGGITLNITNSDFEKYFVKGQHIHTTIYKNDKAVYEADILYGDSFGNVGIDEPIIYHGSSKYVCIDLNQGNFMEKYNIESGKEWKFKLEVK